MNIYTFGHLKWVNNPKIKIIYFQINILFSIVNNYIVNNYIVTVYVNTYENIYIIDALNIIK